MRTTTLLLALLLGAASCESTPSPSDLKPLFEASQREKGPDIEPDRLAELDRRRVERIAEVREILAVSPELGTMERFHAAAILLDSDLVEDLDLASELALSVAEDGDDRGFSMAAEAIDRSLLYRGLPQKYGTQYVYTPVTGQWSLYTWDPTTTDAERHSMGVFSLAEALARVAELNGPAPR